MIWPIFFILGILLFVSELWCVKHTWVHQRYDQWEKYDFKIFHALLLLVMNIIPIVNIIGAIIYFIAMYADNDNYIRLMPPEGAEEGINPSNFDKWLNKSI